MTPGAWTAIAAVVVALVFGLYRAATDGRFRGTHRLPPNASTPDPEEPPVAEPVSILDGTRWESEVGDRATLLQFSSAFCAPCRSTRRVLDEVAATTAGVAHIEVDAEQHLDVVRRLGILRTPTTLVLDSAGREVGRAQGAARKDQVLAAISALA